MQQHQQYHTEVSYLDRLRALCTRFLASRARLWLVLLGCLLWLIFLRSRSMTFATTSAFAGSTSASSSTTTTVSMAPAAFHMSLVSAFIVAVLAMAALECATTATTVGAVAAATFHGALVRCIIMAVLTVTTLELLSVFLVLLDLVLLVLVLLVLVFLVVVLFLSLGFFQLLLPLRFTSLLALEIRRFVPRLGLAKDAGLDLSLRTFGRRLARHQRQTRTLTRGTAIAAAFTTSTATTTRKSTFD